MKIVFFIILIIFIGCNKQPKENNSKDSNILSESAVWKEYNTKDSIPYIFYQAFKKSTGGVFRIADPNEEWQKTDIIWSDSVPTRQLKFIANKGNDWRLAYVEGGFGKVNIYAQFQVFGDTLRNLKGIYTQLNIDNNDSVEAHLKSKKLVIP